MAACSFRKLKVTTLWFVGNQINWISQKQSSQHKDLFAFHDE